MALTRGVRKRITVCTLASMAMLMCEPRHASTQPSLQRTDARIAGPAGALFVREVRTDRPSKGPVVLVHGGGGGGVASFDLEVPGYSLAATLATAGHRVYIMDIRGWGRSDRPAVLSSTDPLVPPAVTSAEVVQDIAAVVTWVRRHTEADRIALVGHASGGHWAGMYAAQHNSVVSHLVMINTMYGVKTPWSLTNAMQDPANPGTFNPRAGACRYADRNGLLANWNNAIPGDDKTSWRDPRVADAYVKETIDPDPTATTRTPPSACLPRGFQRDHFEMAHGKRFWSAEDVRAATLVVRGGRDHWSRPEDVAALRDGLRHAARVEILEIPDATHFVFLDRPERGHDVFVTRLIEFLGH
jgi:pimeloyl-ACP methyl ester carboxylesterase